MSIPLTMETLCGGGVIESLHHEIQNVLDNVADPNTEAKKVREVRLVIKVKPNDHRNMADVTVQASSKLIAAAPLATSIIIDKDGNRTVAAELYGGENPGQLTLPEIAHNAHNISQFKKEAANA
jgi:hypothetical protein